MQNILRLQSMTAIEGDKVEEWSTVSNACNNGKKISID